MTFDVKGNLVKIQGRNYLPVSARIVWFREEHPDWGIKTHPIEINNEMKYAIFHAEIYNAEGQLMASGTKREDIKGFPDWVEKSETGSIGRALALCGFGTQFEGSFHEGTSRLVDSPVEDKAPVEKKPMGRPKKTEAPKKEVKGYWGEHPETGEQVYFQEMEDGTYFLRTAGGKAHPKQVQPIVEDDEEEVDISEDVEESEEGEEIPEDPYG